MSNAADSEDAPLAGTEGERLHSVLVSYEDAADRRTLYPPEASEAERLTTWLSANDDVFERLDEMR